MNLVLIKAKNNYDAADIKQIWEIVFEKSRHRSPFLSWYWVKEVLESVKSESVFLYATLGGEPIGAGVLFIKRTGLKKVAFLNRTGIPKYDQPWIEYNDFVCVEEHEKEAKIALVEYCFSKLKFDELVVGASLKNSLSTFSLYFEKQRVEWYSQAYQVNLAKYKTYNDYLSSLSSNTRYQVQKARREYNKIGTCRIDVATTEQEAHEWLENAAPLHIDRWGKTRVGSGFENPHFVNFHVNLIKECLKLGNVELLTIKFGKQPIAYLYNFVFDKQVYFYLSANLYSSETKHLKPGVVAHSLAIEYYLSRGFDTYDFMGGESQYKRSLATKGEPISVVRFQRSNTINLLESNARRFKQLCFSQTKKQSLPQIKLLITGGQLNDNGFDSKHKTASVSILELSDSSRIKQISRLNFAPTDNSVNYPTKPNIVFKSASLTNNLLYVSTETEIKVVDINCMKVVNSISLACFNDLHHVIKHNNSFFIANTGLDCVTELSIEGDFIKHFDVVDSNIPRLKKDIDYRQLPSTKPHLAHPNFCFVLNDEVWTTRCDFMDAVTIKKPRKHLFIGDGLVHDGVVYGKYIYFTTVTGHIKVYDKKTTELHCDLNLQIIDRALNGWFRGICPISDGKVIIGMSKARRSKRIQGTNDGSSLILIDIYRKEIIFKWDVSELGYDAIFSIIGVPGK